MKLTAITSLAGSYHQVYPAPDGSGDIFTCSGGALQRVDRELRIKWSSKPIGAHYIATVEDVDADGRLEILTSTGRSVILLSAEDGGILWSYDVGPPFSYGTYATMFQCEQFLPNARGQQFTVPCFSHKEVLLFDCSDGAERTKLLHSLWMNDAYHPTTVIGDVNGDGLDEIVIARLGGVYVFDPVSGSMISSTQWVSDDERRRNYGHLELSDTDGNGRLNAVIISDRVTRHIALLENDGQGNFSPRWDRFIEHIYPDDSTELRYTYGSVTPVGIAVSTFNSTIANKWCTEIIDPANGKSIERWEDQWLAGATHDRLYLQRADERAVTDFGELSIVNLDGSQPSVLSPHYSRRSQFAKRAHQYRGKKGQFKPEVFGSEDVWCNAAGDPFVITELSGRYILHSFSDVGSRALIELDEPFRIGAVVDDACIITTRSGKLLRTDSAAKLQLGYHLTTEAHLSARPGVQATSSAEAMIVPRFDGTVLVGSIGKETILRGRGRLGYDNVYHNVPILDVGGRECFALVTDEKLARIQIYDLNCDIQSTIELPHLPPSKHGFRIGVYDWQYFGHSRGPALYLAAYRSPSMNSECSLAVLIESGKILWETKNAGEGEFGRGIGPWGSSTLTILDAMQCVIFCAKDTLAALDLESGAFARPPVLLTDFTKAEMQRQGIFKEQGFDTWSTIEDPFTAYGSVIARDIDYDGIDEYLICGCFGGFGVLNSDFTARWWRISPFGDVLYRMPAIADLNGDGELEWYQSHSDGSMRVYSVLTGEEVASVKLVGVATDLAVSGDSVIATTNFGNIFRLGWSEGKFGMLDQMSTDAALGSPIASNDTIRIASANGALYSFTDN